MLSPTSSCTPVITGVTSSREAATPTWATAVGEFVGRHEAGLPADLRDARVFLDGHGQQREVRRSGAHDDAWSLRSRAARVRSGASLAISARSRPETRTRAGLLDVGGDLGLRRDLVVERRQLQPGIGGLDQDAAQDGQGRALRKELDGERDGFAEHIPIGLELHEVTSVVGGKWIVTNPSACAPSGESCDSSAGRRLSASPLEKS